MLLVSVAPNKGLEVKSLDTKYLARSESKVETILKTSKPSASSHH